uniref:Uncharacterized protein n=2 Tax=Entamoeba invadens TaxID=33085 RepID=S0B3C7_ENTIV|nr:hypothetical protein [Entamoeba invadens]BAN41938.1 hypothetical protein [Entamoeba invadens]
MSNNIHGGLAEGTMREEVQQYHNKWESHQDIDMSNDSTVWCSMKKHVFIYTDAGKPVFSRYGDEIKLAPFMGTLTALSSVVADVQDVTDEVCCDDGLVIVFHSVGPIEIVFVGRTGETSSNLKYQAEMVGRKICSIVPYTTILSLFQKKTSYDFRRLLLSEYDQLKFFIHSLNESSAVLYDSVRIMPCANREEIATKIQGHVMQYNEKLKKISDSIVFVALFHKFEILTVFHRVGCVLSPKDMHVLMSFVLGLPSTTDKWVPIGLFDFNKSGQLFAFCHFLNVDLALVILTTKNEAIEIVRETSNEISESLKSTPFIKQLIFNDSIDLQFEVDTMSYLHFLYIQFERPYSQLFEPEFQDVYKSDRKQIKRIHKIFLLIFEQMNNQDLKEYFSKGGVDCIYAVRKRSYFFVGTFNLMLQRDDVMEHAMGIIKQIKEKNDVLFHKSLF